MPEAAEGEEGVKKKVVKKKVVKKKVVEKTDDSAADDTSRADDVSKSEAEPLANGPAIAEEPAPAAAPAAKKPAPSLLSAKTRTKKAGGSLAKKIRSSSDAMNTFDQRTMQEFKEAFTIMDQNKDGFIDKQDLKDMYAQLGQMVADSQLDEMIREAPGPINFTMFLNLFGDRLTGTDPEDTIIGAFQMFDKKDTGHISEDQLVKILTNKRGEPLSDEEIKGMYKGNPPISGGQVDYKAFARLITTGAQDELSKE